MPLNSDCKTVHIEKYLLFLVIFVGVSAQRSAKRRQKPRGVWTHGMLRYYASVLECTRQVNPILLPTRSTPIYQPYAEAETIAVGVELRTEDEHSGCMRMVRALSMWLTTLPMPIFVRGVGARVSMLSGKTGLGSCKYSRGRLKLVDATKFNVLAATLGATHRKEDMGNKELLRSLGKTPVLLWSGLRMQWPKEIFAFWRSSRGMGNGQFAKVRHAPGRHGCQADGQRNFRGSTLANWLMSASYM